jgi:hypothetical protein
MNATLAGLALVLGDLLPDYHVQHDLKRDRIDIRPKVLQIARIIAADNGDIIAQVGEDITGFGWTWSQDTVVTNMLSDQELRELRALVTGRGVK